MNDDNLVEAMAKAMYEAHLDPNVPWQSLGGFWRITYLEKATAALEAYRIATQDDGK